MPSRLRFTLRTSSLSLRALLLIRLAGALVMLALICVLGAVLLARADRRIQSVVGDTLSPVSDVGRIQSDYNDSFQSIAHAVMTRLPSSVDDAKTALKSNRVDIERHWKPLAASGLGVQEKQLLATAAEHRKAAEQSMDETLTMLDAEQYDIAQVKLSSELQPALLPLQTDFTNLFEKALAAGSEQAAAQHQNNRHGLILLQIAFVIALALACVIDGGIIRSLGKRLTLASGVAERIAQGQLGQGVAVGRQDEIGMVLRHLSTMDRQLANVVEQVRAAAAAVRHDAQNLASASDLLNQRTQSQAAHLEETSASMEQMAATVAESAGHATQADRVARQSKAQAAHGESVMNHAVASMSAIHENSRRIAEFVGLIDEVAFQTNLLALNAAVEAARAGEHGRGFAVVATEVRALAQRCGVAAHDIRRTMDASDQAIADAGHLVGQSGRALIELADSAQQVAEKVAAIALAGREQSAGIEQVNRAVADMDEMTQQNAVMVQRVAVTSQAMRGNADALLAQVDFFRIATMTRDDGEAAPHKPAMAV
ncbi:MAG TPA: methyl-accepting chemotaxis protein [Dyella sp.]|uniref:methyl-accepting chemotaxis protein n=1 Tax=Dyella sp. TaxID=1869338 RepID=UPI002F94AB0F